MKNKLINTAMIFTLSFAAAAANAENVVLINPFNVPENKLDESIQFWEKARNFLSQEPGYVSTKLHSSLKPKAEYQLINVAEWKSAAEFKAATKKMRAYFKKNKIAPPTGLKPNAALYSVIRN